MTQKKMSKRLECPSCGKKFETNRPFQKYCCNKCRVEYNYKKNKKEEKGYCIWCYKRFIKKRKDKLYCSKKCRTKKATFYLRKEKKKYKCKMCSKVFFQRFNRNIYCSTQCQKKAHKKISMEYNKKLRKISIHHKLRHNISSRILLSLKKGETKSKRTLELLGCSIRELKNHLKEQFKQGMTWENYGEWEMDHIIPCAYFDLSKEKDQELCFNFKNLQPLWKWENNKKNSYYNGIKYKTNKKTV